MENFDLICEIVPKTVVHLTETVHDVQIALNGKGDKRIRLEVLQHALLKRFDLCCIYLLKYGAALLRSRYQIKLRFTTPKKVFNTLHQKGLITQDELTTLLATIKIRRLTRKCYDETYIEKTMQEIVKSLPAIEQVAQKLLPKK
jgi:uncharacterized protein YutE (UPF0331/DUF86 family)